MPIHAYCPGVDNDNPICGDPFATQALAWHDSAVLPAGVTCRECRWVAAIHGHPSTWCQVGDVRRPPSALDDLADRFTYHPPTAEQPDFYRLIRDAGHLMALVILHTAKPSRNRELALEHIESAVMRANAAIARHDLADSAITRTVQQVADVCWDALAVAKPSTQLLGIPPAAKAADPQASAAPATDPWAWYTSPEPVPVEGWVPPYPVDPYDPRQTGGRHRA